MTCRSCDQPAVSDALPWCPRCIRAEGARRMPYAAVAIEALQLIDCADLAAEVWRRMANFDTMPLPFDDTLERLTYE